MKAIRYTLDNGVGPLQMMTQSMEYGWRAKDPELYKKDPEMFHPRMKSRETAYSEALILGPRHP